MTLGFNFLSLRLCLRVGHYTVAAETHICEDSQLLRRFSSMWKKGKRVEGLSSGPVHHRVIPEHVHGRHPQILKAFQNWKYEHSALLLALSSHVTTVIAFNWDGYSSVVEHLTGYQEVTSSDFCSFCNYR